MLKITAKVAATATPIQSGEDIFDAASKIHHTVIQVVSEKMIDESKFCGRFCRPDCLTIDFV